MSGEREILKKSALFSTFRDDVLDEFVNAGKVRTYPAGEVIVTETTEGDEIFQILEGVTIAEMELLNKNQPHDIFTCGPVDNIGAYRFIMKAPSPATVTAKTDVKVLVWKAADWRKICENDFEVGYRLAMGVAKQLYERLGAFSRHILDSVFWGLE